MKVRQLTGLDAGFLTLETANAPMLIGGVSILDPRTEGGELDVDAFRALMRGRLGRTVAFRRRLASLPLDLARPYWVEIPAEEVDLEFHVQPTELPEPGGWHELSQLMAFELGRPLDRRRPLWQILWVKGLRTVPGVPEGAVALVSKVHHAAIDGVSGAEIMAALYDTAGDLAGRPSAAELPASLQRSPAEPEPGAGAATRGDPAEGSEEAEPGALELLSRLSRDLAAAPLHTSRVVGRSLLGLAGSAWSRARGAGSAPLPFTAPRTPLNRPVSSERSWAPAFFELDRIRAVKTAAESTVNDVVLAVCAAALRGWLLERGELPRDPLVAMVPVSVRHEAERRDAGNRVSAMLVSLATDEPDPLSRLRSIRDAARSAKVAHRAVGAQTLVQSADLLPFALSGLGVRLYSSMHLAERHRPIFNLVITNVPGPPRPLTVGGARLLAHAGAAPVFDGLGLILPVFSYAGKLSIGVTADRRILPHPVSFAARLTDALDELEAAVGP